MAKRVAVFVDWDNLRKTIEHIQRTTCNRGFNFNNPSHLSLLFASFLEQDEEFYRIYFYTAPHPDITQIEKRLKSGDKKKFHQFITKNPDYTSKIDLIEKFLEQVAIEDYVALRLGKLLIRGVDNFGHPLLAQKQVDMLLGLDISHVAYGKLADRILIFSADTDMIPAMKVARVQGINVGVAKFSENGKNLNHGLLKHTDLVRVRSYEEISNKAVSLPL